MKQAGMRGTKGYEKVTGGNNMVKRAVGKQFGQFRKFNTLSIDRNVEEYNVGSCKQIKMN